MRDSETLTLNCKNSRLGLYFLRVVIFDRPFFTPTEPKRKGTSSLSTPTWVCAQGFQVMEMMKEFFWVGKFGMYFFGWLDLSREYRH